MVKTDDDRGLVSSGSISPRPNSNDAIGAFALDVRPYRATAGKRERHHHPSGGVRALDRNCATGQQFPNVDGAVMSEPTKLEIKALEAFVCTDEIRANLATIWLYESEGGDTLMATDGHTLVYRSMGTHRDMSATDICKLPGQSSVNVDPPMWGHLVDRKIKLTGPLPEFRGVNPSYLARVALIERAAGNREANESDTLTKEERRNLNNGACAVWTVGTDPMDPWLFRIETASVLWRGLIMPRRV